MEYQVQYQIRESTVLPYGHIQNESVASTTCIVRYDTIFFLLANFPRAKDLVGKSY